MSKLPINLTRLVVEEELETLWDSIDYPSEFSNPHIQHALIDEVLCQIPNRYILLDATRQDALPSLLSCISTCTRLKIEDLLKRGIRHRLTQPKTDSELSCREAWDMCSVPLGCQV